MKQLRKQQIVFLFAVFLFMNLAYSQQVKLIGKVTDTLFVPILNATVYSQPLGHEEGLHFSITDMDGNYNLNLSKGKTYIVTISNLGYDEIKDTLSIVENKVKNYTLSQSTETLDEIILRKKLAVSVKKDTITYQVDQFINGNERKLRDVLKKLPGLDVDREGNVTVNGKEVTKLMVDGKDFFNGDEKLGVNNIPADAIEEIVALDNYTAIPWLKGLTDSDELALNIKLKEGKRNFVFGDITAGAGVKERYKVNPLLFYYSPKTAVNFIGDFNNTGVRSFKTSDYLNFEIDNSSLLNNVSSITETLNDDVAKSLSNDDFRDLKTIFGAFNINHDFKSGINITAYTINNNNNQLSRNESQINYLTNQNLSESRFIDNSQDLFFTANTVKLNYTTSQDLDILGRVDFKDFTSDYERRLQSVSANNSQFNNLTQATGNTFFSSKLDLNKKFNSKNISTLETSFKLETRDNKTQNLFVQPIFSGIVPLVAQNSGVFDLSQLSITNTSEFNLGMKHYYVINSSTHLYPLVGLKVTNTVFDNSYFQILDNGTVNSFESQGFNNILSSKIGDYYAGLQLKKKYGNYIVKPALVAHLYDWNAQQMQTEIISNSKVVALPELMVEYESSNTRKLRFKYQMRSRFANPINFANRLRINSFNQLALGNENLENSLSHNYSLGYSSFKLLEGTILNASLSYSHFIKGIRNSTNIQGINQVQTLIYTSLPEDNYSARFKYSTYLWNLKWSYNGNLNLSDYKRVINEATLGYNSLFASNKIEVETRFKKGLNFEIELEHQLNDLEGSGISNNFETWNSTAIAEISFLKNFLFKSDFDLTYFKNNVTRESNDFNTLNASIEYWKESSAWSFRVDATNLLDNQIRLSNSINQFQSTENQVFVQPRIIMLSISYKL